MGLIANSLVNSTQSSSVTATRMSFNGEEAKGPSHLTNRISHGEVTANFRQWRTAIAVTAAVLFTGSGLIPVLLYFLLRYVARLELWIGRYDEALPPESWLPRGMRYRKNHFSSL